MKVTIIEGTAQEVKKILPTIGSSQEDNEAVAGQEAARLAEAISKAPENVVITTASE